MPTPRDVTKAELEALQLTRATLLANLLVKLPVSVQANTYWEQLACVGFHPLSAQLEAVVSVKQATGYSGGLCTKGSTEYVRFFVDYGTGAGFQDVGLASCQVHDISDVPPGPQHPVEYMVHLHLSDENYRKFCFSPVLPKVRAILSWNTIPPINPNYVPPFGNALDANIQLQPGVLTLIGLIREGVLKKDLPVLENIDLETKLPPGPPQPVALATLAPEYRKAKVPDHRTLFHSVQPLLAPFEAQATIPPSGWDADAVEKLGIKVADVIGALLTPKSDTSFEELACVGLETAADLLGGVIHVKKPLGYSGHLCQSGSREYVAFWADWNNDGTYDEYLGTAFVDVHDIPGIPADGLRYAVYLPTAKIVHHLKSCDAPGIIRIRGVLSWASAPSTVDPNAIPHWGNRVDAIVQLRPGVAQAGLTDLIYRVGGVPIPNISPITHLAYPSSGALDPADCAQPATDRPFGGMVWIQGRIYNTGLPHSVRYRVRYKKHSDADVEANWHPVTFSHTFVLVHPFLVPSEVYVPVTSPDGWFDYLEDPLAAPPVFERDNSLASWYTGTLEGAYDLRLEYYAVAAPGIIHHSSLVTIILDNTNYTRTFVAGAALDFTQTLDLVIDGGDCHSYAKGTTFAGKLRAVDAHFGHWALDLQPDTHTHGATASPACRSYVSPGDAGDGSANWNLDTAPLDKCGYTLTLRAYDRAIVDSNGAVVHENFKAVGFAVV